MSARYEISEGELDVLAITGPEGTRYIDGEEIEARAIRQQARDIAELEVFAEIGRQWNSDSSLAKWFPLTAERVEQDAQEIAKLRTDLAAAVSENAAILAANRDLKAHFDALKGDYDEAAHFARHFIRDDAAITPRGAIIRLGDKCTSLFARMKIAETERDEWIACHAQLYRKLGNLLAVIHRDGGHYESEHGMEKACEDAMQRICDTRAGLGAADELAMLVRRLARALQKAAPDNDLPKTAMDNNIAKIRAALEQAREYIRSDLASERGAFEGHEGVSRIDEIKIDLANNAAAIAALAELEKAASEPVGELTNAGTVHAHQFTVFYSSKLPAGTKLYAAPPAPVAEIREVVVTDEMCDSAYLRKWETQTSLSGAEPDDEDRQWAREWLSAWRAELGPALGMVEIREPTPEECKRICTEYERLLMREGTCGGRDAFDAVKAVMWPKEGES